MEALDLCAALTLAAFLFVGSKLTERRPAARAFGLRLGVVLGVLGGLRLLWRDNPAEAGDWLGLLIRAAVLGGASTAAAWILLTALDVASWPAVWLWRRSLLWRAGLSDRRWLRREQQQAEQRQRQWEEEQRQRAPERERERQEAERRLQDQAEAHRRREEARAGCLLFFELHAPDLGARFTRAQFDHYLERFMSDREPPEVVEERGTRLIDLISQHAARTAPAKNAGDIDAVLSWYDEQRKKIEASALDDRTKRTFLAGLKARLTERLEEEIGGP